MLARYDLRGVKLVISDAHKGIKASVAKVMTASWQRRWGHVVRNVLVHAGCSDKCVISASFATYDEGRMQRQRVADLCVVQTDGIF